jgi:hypothetical protein
MVNQTGVFVIMAAIVLSMAGYMLGASIGSGSNKSRNAVIGAVIGALIAFFPLIAFVLPFVVGGYAIFILPKPSVDSPMPSKRLDTSY